MSNLLFTDVTLEEQEMITGGTTNIPPLPETFPFFNIPFITDSLVDPTTLVPDLSSIPLNNLTTFTQI